MFHFHVFILHSINASLFQAQNIKNFKSQRWQMLLNFSSQRRLLLTGTPLQNSLMELWSLMHFLMPNVFQSHSEFKEWFSNPLTGMIEGSQEYNENLVRRLHKVRFSSLLFRYCNVNRFNCFFKALDHIMVAQTNIWLPFQAVLYASSTSILVFILLNSCIHLFSIQFKFFFFIG